MLIKAKDITKGFDGDFLYKNVSFKIESRDKIGLVGKTAQGKQPC